MIYTLKNNDVSVKIDSLGAQIISVKRGELEYIWQGDPQYWAGHAPILFPICGRLASGKYRLDGKEYEMNLHGFARKTEFELVSLADEKITLSLTPSDAIYAQYPFDFVLTVSYTLDGGRITSDVKIENTGDKTLPATFGAHPGFNVPLDSGSFENWCIEFDTECTPNRLLLADNGLNTGKKEALALEGGKRITLRHSLFDIDGIFMDKIPHAVTLKSKLSSHSVTLRYPDMSYLGIWHAARTEAPFVCIEPWCGLPGFDGQIDDIFKKNDMFHVAPKAEKHLKYEIEFN